MRHIHLMVAPAKQREQIYKAAPNADTIPEFDMHIGRFMQSESVESMLLMLREKQTEMVHVVIGDDLAEGHQKFIHEQDPVFFVDPGELQKTPGGISNILSVAESVDGPTQGIKLEHYLDGIKLDALMSGAEGGVRISIGGGPAHRIAELSERLTNSEILAPLTTAYYRQNQQERSSAMRTMAESKTSTFVETPQGVFIPGAATETFRPELVA